jgi:hypothetical protein
VHTRKSIPSTLIFRIALHLTLSALEKFNLPEAFFRRFAGFVRSPEILTLAGNHFVTCLHLPDHVFPRRKNIAPLSNNKPRVCEIQGRTESMIHLRRNGRTKGRAWRDAALFKPVCKGFVSQAPPTTSTARIFFYFTGSFALTSRGSLIKGPACSILPLGSSVFISDFWPATKFNSVSNVLYPGSSIFILCFPGLIAME